MRAQLLSHGWCFATPWTAVHQAPLSMGFPRQEYRSGLPFPSPWDLPDWGIEPRSLTLAGGFLTSVSPGNPCWSIADYRFQFSSVHLLSCVWLFAAPWTASRQASLSITNSWSLLKLMSIELAMPFNHLILCFPLLLLPSVFSSIRVFSKESVLHIRWPKFWSISVSISPSSDYSGLISFRMDWLNLLAAQGTLRRLLQHHRSEASVLQCTTWFMVQLSRPDMTTGKTTALTRRACFGITVSGGQQRDSAIHTHVSILSQWRRNGIPLQYPCLENSVDRGAWWATVRGVTKSWTQLSDFILPSPYCILKRLG